MTADKKPPFGVEPEWLFKVKRLRRLEKSMSRYVEVGYPIPVAWTEERNKILSTLSPEQYTNFNPRD